MQEFNKKYFKKNNQYYKLSELNIAFKYLKVYPLGGGFQTTIKLNDYFLNKWREGEYVFTNEMPVIMETGKFGFDCWDKNWIKGWHNPFERWNGWRVPWFTLKDDGNNRPYFLFEKGKVLYWDNQEEEKSVIEPIIYNLGGWDKTPLYDVSLGINLGFIRRRKRNCLNKKKGAFAPFLLTVVNGCFYFFLSFGRF